MRADEDLAGAREMLEKLQRANVAIYAFDPNGLQTGAVSAEDARPGVFHPDNIGRLNETLRMFAEGTGGRAITDVNTPWEDVPGVFAAGDVTTAANASTAVTSIDTALDTITTNRATYGAAMSRFQFAISNLQITGENQTAARGRIMDADFAAETANLSRAQILQQAGSAMVAQANQLPNQVLALLR